MIVDAMAEIYLTTGRASFNLKNLEGPNTKGTGTLLLDGERQPRISIIMNSGLGHAWPSGKDSATKKRTFKYINPHSVNYPLYLGEFFVREN